MKPIPYFQQPGTCLLLALLIYPCYAEVTLDGSLGGSARALPGPDYAIQADMGMQRGGNLFHSFGDFNLSAAETATFNDGGVIAPVENILSRVTGGRPSNIDGRISTRFADSQPNLFFMNPAGVVFGPNASLDVQGSFHVTTANCIKLGNGDMFHADLNEKTTLSVASVETFGFLEDAPASIVISGSQLNVLTGENISLVGANITIKGDGTPSLDNPHVTAPGGQINITSVASRGVLGFNSKDQTPAPDISLFNQLGQIAISDGAFIHTNNDQGGNVTIRSEELIIDNAYIFSDTLNQNGAATGIGIQVDQLIMDHEGWIRANTYGEGNAGHTFISADQVNVNQGAQIDSVATNSGSGGNITITATESISITDRSEAGYQSSVVSGTVFSGTVFSELIGHGGNLTITAPLITVDDGIIATRTENKGKGGKLTLLSDKLVLLRGAGISSSVGGNGPGGDANIIVSGEILLTGFDAEGEPSIILSASDSNGKPGDLYLRASSIIVDGGIIGTPPLGSNRTTAELEIESNQLSVINQGQIHSRTLSDATAGNITIRALDSILVSGDGRIFAETTGSGDAGTIDIKTPYLTMTEGGQISSATKDSGQGGNIKIRNTEQIIIDNARISASSESNFLNPGSSGNITITNTGSLILTNNGQITVETAQANAGDIDLTLDGTLQLNDNSTITTSAAVTNNQATGNGGNINIKSPDINPTFAILDDSSQIIAQAQRGSGGEINIDAKTVLFRAPGSLISASSNFGESGTVTIDSPDTNLIDSALILPGSFLDASALLSQRCADRSGKPIGSFIIKPLDGLQPTPEDYLSGFYTDRTTPTAANSDNNPSLPQAIAMNHREDSLSSDCMGY